MDASSFCAGCALAAVDGPASADAVAVVAVGAAAGGTGADAAVVVVVIVSLVLAAACVDDAAAACEDRLADGILCCSLLDRFDAATAADARPGYMIDKDGKLDTG